MKKLSIRIFRTTLWLSISYLVFYMIGCSQATIKKRLVYKVIRQSESFDVSYILSRKRGDLVVYGKEYKDKSTMPDTLFVISNEYEIVMNGIVYSKKKGSFCDTLLEDNVPFRVCSKDKRFDNFGLRTYIVHNSDLQIVDIPDQELEFYQYSKYVIPYRIENLGSTSFTVKLIEVNPSWP